MPIEFRCEHCGRLLQVPEGHAGHEAQCAGCGHRQTIPASSQPVPPLPPSFTNPRIGDPRIAERVETPAVCLMLLGGLGILSPLTQILATALRISLLPGLVLGGRFPLTPLVASGQLAFSLHALALAALILYGGWSMYRLERLGWARGAAILALIPCLSPCCLVGIPLGVWALVVLAEPPVAAAFRA